MEYSYIIVVKNESKNKNIGKLKKTAIYIKHRK